jgi:hypothetical protein
MRKKGTKTVYRIVVRGELSGRDAVGFEGMQLETKNGLTGDEPVVQVDMSRATAEHYAKEE